MTEMESGFPTVFVHEGILSFKEIVENKPRK